MRNSNEILQELGLVAIERDDVQAELRRNVVTSALDADAHEKRATNRKLIAKAKGLSEVWQILRTEYDATINAEEYDDAISEQDIYSPGGDEAKE